MAVNQISAAGGARIRNNITPGRKYGCWLLALSKISAPQNKIRLVDSENFKQVLHPHPRCTFLLASHQLRVSSQLSMGCGESKSSEALQSAIDHELAAAAKAAKWNAKVCVWVSGCVW